MNGFIVLLVLFGSGAWIADGVRRSLENRTRRDDRPTDLDRRRW